MRKILLALSLVGLTVWASTDDAFARGRSGGGGSGGGRGSSNRGGGSAGRNNGGGGGGRGYGGGGYGGGGYYGGGLFGGLGYYGGGYGGGYAPNYYDGTPAYSNYADPAALVPPNQARQAYYPAPVQDSVNVNVLVPVADAQVWFQGRATTQQGMQRLFESPSLAPNHSYTYSIKARWMENGQAVNQERQVNVQAGQNITVNFREPIRENLAAPMSRTPDAIRQP